MTIKDIAKEVGVSIATVSRVVNGSSHPVKQETKEAVMEVINKYGFNVNALASGLKSNKSSLLAFIVADITNTFFMEIAKGIENISEKNNYSLLLADTHGEAKKEIKIIQKLINRKVDGIILATSSNDGEAVKLCREHNVPIVLVDRRISNNINTVLWNDYEGSKLLTNYVLSMGHTKIAVENVSLMNNTGKDRLRGIEDALEENGITLHKDFVSGSNFTLDDAYSHVVKLLSRKDRPTCIICNNNQMAKGALKAIKQFGLEIPSDISLCCFGNPETNHYGLTSITTLEQDTKKMGKSAAELLLASMKDSEEIKTVEIKTELKIRNSVKKL